MQIIWDAWIVTCRIKINAVIYNFDRIHFAFRAAARKMTAKDETNKYFEGFLQAQQRAISYLCIQPLNVHFLFLLFFCRCVRILVEFE